MASPALDLHPSPDIEIAAAGDLGGAEEDVPAVAASAVNPDRVLSAVGGRAIKGHRAALAAVGRVGGPRRLVPSALEVARDLGGREGGEAEGEAEEGGLAEHGCGGLLQIQYYTKKCF